ncbi:prepilin-type N-terminal cleavage/methylation domain-containing protein [Baileyella intestinalis]|uniref:prepilin-type N-terminal cleavage/methylation domain-containing protein n=1 Tax=Baileyella intestinalis TaxID=2606709 RepID=UPI0022DE9D56|nr:prepilin-type N-terminal cleavage/methylation domain-containing protein [Baileyella intestinalis]
MIRKMRENGKKGFTLAELLIVVAIIAVLVAISIPIFSAQLEKSREATDAANIRSAYAEVSADLLTNDSSTKSVDVVAKQKKADWQGTDYSKDSTIGGQHVDASTTGWTVSADSANNKVTITAK